MRQLLLDRRKPLDSLSHEPVRIYLRDLLPKVHLEGVERKAVRRAPIVDDGPGEFSILRGGGRIQESSTRTVNRALL
jgi:hypothetical protein